MTGTLNANGEVNLGNATSDTITATGRFDSDLIPSADSTFSLGSSTMEWGNLFIDGTAHIDTLDVDQNAGIIGNLTVTGTSEFNNTVDVDANFAVRSGSTDKFTVASSTGNAVTNGTLTVGGASHLLGNVDVDADFAVRTSG